MRSRKVMKWLAAAAVGAMMMLPMTASAASWVTEHKGMKPQLDSSVPVMGLTATYVEDYEGEFGDDEVVIHWNPVVPEDYYMVIEESTDPNFADSEETYYRSSISHYANENYDYYKDNEITSSKGAGGIYYLRAILYQWKEDAEGNDYYAYSLSPAVEVTVPAPDAYVDEQTVNGTSVDFRFDNYGVTGYEIQRKVGKKFTTIAKISDNVYTDKGLQKNKTYEYKIRTYIYNSAAKKTIYGDWVNTTATTWGKALNVKAVPGKKSTVVNLTWNKVPDASGYEIYRSVGRSDGPMKNGLSPYFENAKLIKIITKAKTKKYTDKGLIPGNDYTYYVVAYKNVAGKKEKDMTVCDYDYVSLDLHMNVVSNVENKDGSRKITWKKVVGANGFKVMKYTKDATTDEWKWVEYQSLGASARSALLPAAATPGDSEDYRIYAYKGTKKSNVVGTYTTHNYSNVNVAPSGIKAVAVNGGTAVTVSWQPVAGAAYYVVERSTRMMSYVNDNADLGRYNSDGTYVWIPKQPQNEDDDYSTYKIEGTSVTDQYIPYTNPQNPDAYYYPINEGPEPGMTYYYYVTAYKWDGKPVEEGEDPNYDSSWNAKPAKVTLSKKVSLKQPKISSVKSSKKGQVKISWKNVKGAKTYYVYCSTKKKSKNYMCVGSTSKKNLTVTGLDSNTTYYFKVKAAVGNEMSATTNTSKDSKAKSVKVR